MSDDVISNMLEYYRHHRLGACAMVAERACADIKQLAAALDGSASINNQLADQSARLRALVEQRGAVLAKIQLYCDECFKAAIDKHARFCLGTVSNMVKQCVDVERTCEPTEAAG